jgi:hypothetical protein
VFPFLPQAGAGEPGSALYLPPQGGRRLDNPDLYSVFYGGDRKAGAVAESFGRFPEWPAAILDGSPALPGSSRAIARFHLADTARICDLDDPAQLAALGLRPSDIVSRDYARTRNWARRIYQEPGWAGVRWWSYYDPRWTSYGLWETGALALADVRVLRLDDAAVGEAARTIARGIVAGSR